MRPGNTLLKYHIEWSSEYGIVLNLIQMIEKLTVSIIVHISTAWNIAKFIV